MEARLSSASADAAVFVLPIESSDPPMLPSHEPPELSCMLPLVLSAAVDDAIEASSERVGELVELRLILRIIARPATS